LVKWDKNNPTIGLSFPEGTLSAIVGLRTAQNRDNGYQQDFIQRRVTTSGSRIFNGPQSEENAWQRFEFLQERCVVGKALSKYEVNLCN